MISPDMFHIPFDIFITILYAEIHYRFPFFPFSRYHKREPEIIIDAPYRLEPNQFLPILLLVKDAHKFPVLMKSVQVVIRDSHGQTKEIVIKKNLQVQSPWWHETFHIDVNEFSGPITLKATVSYSVNGKNKQCVNHNYKGLETRDLKIFIASESLPGKNDGWHWGDLHYHSNLTEDYTEFGAPLKATRDAAKAMGLSFVCITDHSYDLDDLPGSWTESDPNLTKWNSSRKEISQLNQDGLPLLIPSEEVTTTNSRGHNIHTLVINHPTYFPGSGDGAEKWFKTHSELTTTKVIEELTGSALAIAAHPGMKVPFLEKLLLRRGCWEQEDYEIDGISGFQVANGGFTEDFSKGLRHWIDLLLRGEKKYIYAGNDAHGNFNRFLQIKMPMVSLWEHSDQILGKCRTGVILEGNPTVENITRSLKMGKCVISNGPLLEMTAKNIVSSITLGESINGDNIEVYLNCQSTKEFGQLNELTLYFGEIDSKKETVLLRKKFNNKHYNATITHEFNTDSKIGYIRGILTTIDEDDREFACYTNPIWINY